MRMPRRSGRTTGWCSTASGRAGGCGGGARPVSRSREKEGPDAKRREDEGLPFPRAARTPDRKKKTLTFPSPLRGDGPLPLPRAGEEPGAALPLERGQLYSHAGAIGVDVGLAGRDADRGDAAAGGDEVVDLAHQHFLQVEPPAFDERADLGPEEIVIPGVAGLVLAGEARLVEPDLDRHQQPLRGADLEFVE